MSAFLVYCHSPHYQDLSDKPCFKYGYLKDGVLRARSMKDCVERLYYRVWNKLTVSRLMFGKVLTKYIT